MPFYGSFYPESVETIKEAFSFVIEKIDSFYQEKMLSVSKLHEKIIANEYALTHQEVESAMNIAHSTLSGYGSYAMSKKQHESLMSFIRSALEVYLKDTEKAKERTGLSTFDSKIQEIKRILDFEGIKSGNPNVFNKYFEVSANKPDVKEIEIFLSYANEDKTFAGKIAELLAKQGVKVFLAHETIKISDKWRNEILRHLERDNILIALLTDNYEKSVWTNQEAGYMIGKNGKIIPLVVGTTDIKKFGFIETYQGIHVTEESIEECVEKIIFTATIGA